MPKGVYTKSDDHKRKLSESRKGKDNGRTGKHHTIETKRKMSERKKGIPFRKGIPWTTTQREKIVLKLKQYCGNRASSWKGGVSFEPYCPKFNKEFKERVRKFFNYTCQLCGHVWQEGERKLAVHHVNYDKMQCCNDVKPLFVPICAIGCHAKTNHNREFYESLFTNLIMIEYNGECYLQKEV